MKHFPNIRQSSTISTVTMESQIFSISIEISLPRALFTFKFLIILRISYLLNVIIVNFLSVRL